MSLKHLADGIYLIENFKLIEENAQEENKEEYDKSLNDIYYETSPYDSNGSLVFQCKSFKRIGEGRQTSQFEGESIYHSLGLLNYKSKYTIIIALDED